MERDNEVTVKELKNLIFPKFKKRKNDLSQFTGCLHEKKTKQKNNALVFHGSVRHGGAIYMRCCAPSAL